MGARLTRTKNRPGKYSLEPDLPVGESQDDMPDFEVLFLSDGGCAVFWDEIVGYCTVRGIGLSYSWSTSRSSSPRGSRSWQSKGSRPSLFVDVTKRGGSSMGAIHTKAGEDSNTNRRASLDNLPSIRMVSLQMSESNARRSRTIPIFHRCRS
jgi:hypothetical protein